MGGSFDRAALSTVGAAYQLQGSLEDWLRRVAVCARPALGADRGLLAATIRVSPGSPPIFTSPLVSTDDVPAGVPELIDGFAGERTPDYVEAAILSLAPLDTASAAYERFHTPLRFRDFAPVDPLRQLGVQDQLAAQGYDASGNGCMLLASFSEIVAPPRRKSVRWGQVMAHLCAGLRLRNVELAPGADEAVLEPGGRVVHAETPAKLPTAREALRRAARTIDRARSSAGQREPAQALADWNALVAGRWSLVETFESDGRRYLVARRNDPRLGYPRALSQRERQVAAYAARGHSNKYIAYALGLAHSTVSSHLNSALRRLGARSAAELASLMSFSDAE